MAHLFVRQFRSEPLRSNKSGVPIPPTAAQAVSAFKTIERDYARKPRLARKVVECLQALMQGFRSPDWQTDAVASRYGREHLNGF